MSTGFEARVTEILTRARASGIRIATAESCTGGMVAAALTEVAGASDVVEGGLVTYSNKAKIDLLGVNSKTLDRYGAVSEEVAAEMALGALARTTAQLSVAITGIAGPGGSAHKPEGRVCFGVAQRRAPNDAQPDAQSDAQPVLCETIEFGALGRAEVRRRARDHALTLLRNALS